MNLNKEQYQELGKRFSEKGFTGKVMLIKMHSDIFYLESDGYNFFLRLVDESAMQNGFDSYFSFPQNLEFTEMKELFSLIGINLKK